MQSLPISRTSSTSRGWTTPRLVATSGAWRVYCTDIVTDRRGFADFEQREVHLEREGRHMRLELYATPTPVR